MDMKRILEKLDTASAKSAIDSNDMKKFVSIVNEGASPHKVALPVQMAMQHYDNTPKKESRPVKDSVLKKYFVEAEEIINKQQAEKKQHLAMYAQKIAQRVLEGRRGDAYERDYQSSISGMGRGHDHRGLEQELAHETNNYGVSINGKMWKVFGSRQEANRVSNAMERKYPDKEISVHATGAEVSETLTRKE
jgi:hypothetical protein